MPFIEIVMYEDFEGRGGRHDEFSLGAHLLRVGRRSVDNLGRRYTFKNP